ncbi:MAG: 2-amino-4-hydroxy-6-hydroxymethyldihydropteridine diphosphokinase [Acidimicrobiales bacterium]
MDQILIDDLRVLCVVGALPHERDAAQPLRIDVAIGADLADAGRTDDLGDTADYGLIAARIVEHAEAGQPVLLERLAAEVAELVLGFERVEEVDVTVTKLRPPVPAPLGTTAVRLRRSRTARPDVVAGPARGHRAVIALGSNLGAREDYLRAAVRGLGPVVAMSQVYETEPIGGPDAQGAYLNMVVVVDTPLDPFALLRRCQSLEAVANRQREVHWGPRTLDVDILFYDDARIETDDLVVPHPRIDQRRFVLVPLSDVAPERCPEGWEANLPPAVVEPRGPLAP